MPYTPDGKNAMLDHLATLADFASLHTADPGNNGANEVAGGNPAYARKAIDWNAAAGGILDNNANPEFDVPGGTTVTHAGFWTAGGTFLAYGAVTPETFAGQGTYTLNDADLDLNAV
jgi:hypothetical protein